MIKGDNIDGCFGWMFVRRAKGTCLSCEHMKPCKAFTRYSIAQHKRDKEYQDNQNTNPVDKISPKKIIAVGSDFIKCRAEQTIKTPKQLPRQATAFSPQ